MQEVLGKGKKVRVLPMMLSLSIAGFVGLFFETALNMAFSDLMKEFAVGPATIQWLTTGYLLTIGILVPVSGLLIQWFTTRQLFVVSVVCATIGTTVAALAPGFGVLMTGRVIQAMGIGLLLPLMYHVTLTVFPAHKRGMAMGMIGLVMMSALALGPTISGLVIEQFTWNWMFWLALPFLAVALLCGVVAMENVSALAKPKIDALSILLSTLGFGGIVFGFSMAGSGSGGWGDPVVAASFVAGTCALALFVWRQFSLHRPMINLRVFQYPMFTLGVLIVFICMMMILSSMLLLPIYIQDGLGLTAFAAGLALLPGGVLNGIMSPVNGRLFDRFGPRRLVIPGIAIAAATLWFFSQVTANTPVWTIVGLHICLMIGTSMIMMPAQTNGLNQLPRELHPDGTALVNTMQQVAGAVGTAVAATIMTAGQRNEAGGAEPDAVAAALTAGVQNGFTFTLTVALIGFILAFLMKRVKTES